MFGLENIFEKWKEQRSSLPPVIEIEGVPENSGWIKKLDKFYNLPLTQDEIYLTVNSSVVEYDIRDLQFRLKRKLRFSELLILRITSDNGIMIMDGDFQP